MSPSVRNIIAWILQVLIALAFIYAGFQKLTHIPQTVKMFMGLGLPGWTAYVVGAGELLGGLGLLWPRTVRLAAAGLIIIMLGAIVMHASKIPGGIGGGAFAIALLVGLLIVEALRWPTRRLA
ncbi:DoxX family protein [Hymenobacter sp. BT770]|uniref:DoxX family protein n=1 Tax=Hymenobacter sp. BT770 TaxID=2886942 RepID=UPI001D112225|nr:DoxX family protein [Hymenobacter sp. BT770]MCC3152069.1 DoxX family protein [Hymenobacter sp. BT770]MDO3415248.1 DoxX family protein [Hymenobacter sp. BT770]